MIISHALALALTGFVISPINVEDSYGAGSDGVYINRERVGKLDFL